MKNSNTRRGFTQQSCLPKGFTLIELLAVVLIIGILAAVALPQYQLAVAKAQFSTLKSITKYVATFAQAYYLEHGTYEGARVALLKDSPDTKGCQIWYDEDFDRVRCCKEIFGNNTCLYVERSSGKPVGCLAYDTSEDGLAFKLCAVETGNSVSDGSCYTDEGRPYCSYDYK